jgi:hypothetical protein
MLSSIIRPSALRFSCIQCSLEKICLAYNVCLGYNFSCIYVSSFNLTCGIKIAIYFWKLKIKYLKRLFWGGFRCLITPQGGSLP